MGFYQSHCGRQIIRIGEREYKADDDRIVEIDDEDSKTVERLGLLRYPADHPAIKGRISRDIRPVRDRKQDKK